MKKSHPFGAVAKWLGNGLQSPAEPTQSDAEAEKKGARDAGTRTKKRVGPPGSGEVGQVDPVEAALADALSKASAAGQWTTVEVLSRELTARREARANVVTLDAVRRSRNDR